GAPAGRVRLVLEAGHETELLDNAPRVPAVRDSREPLELAEREAQRLADGADRSSCAVGRAAGDERGVLPAVAVGDRDDQLLANVARKVEIDVGDGVELAVDEAPEGHGGPDGIDVREPGQVADDRADRAAAAPSGRQRGARRVSTAGGGWHLAGELPPRPGA